MSTHTRQRSLSTSRPPRSRPTTPLRPSSRQSLRSSTSAAALHLPSPTASNARHDASNFDAALASSPLTLLEPSFSELSDSVADLEANFMHLQLLHESLGRFSENFASLLYGMNMNAWCTSFDEAPTETSFKRAAAREADTGSEGRPFDGEATFLTTDTSFIEHPSMTNKSTSTTTTPAKTRASTTARGAAASRGRGTTTRGRGGVPSAAASGRSTSQSGIPAPSARGRGTTRATRARGRGT